MPLERKVRRAWVTSGFINVVAGVPEINLSADAFVAQDRVRIIGFEMTNFIDCSGQVLVADLVAAMSNLSTVPGQLAGLIAMLSSSIMNIGESFGDAFKHLGPVFFPDGHGLDLDEEEAVFLGYNFTNNMGATTMVIFCSAIIYYVER